MVARDGRKMSLEFQPDRRWKARHMSSIMVAGPVGSGAVKRVVILSEQTPREVYGVIPVDGGKAVDNAETEKFRAQMRVTGLGLILYVSN